MDLQTYISNSIKANRAKVLSESDQLTLGEMILKLELIFAKNPDTLKEDVYYDFGSMRPTSIDSWRGSYSELALNYTEESTAMNGEDFLELLKSADGTTFQGYKGGDFTMNKNTPVWVANYGQSGHTAVIDVVDGGGYGTLIVTAYRKY